MISSLFSTNGDGPLSVILSFIHIYELTSKISYTCKSFLKSTRIAILRIDSAYSKSEYFDMFVKRGISESNLCVLLKKSPNFDRSFYFKLKMGSFSLDYNLIHYCFLMNYRKCLKEIFLDDGEVSPMNETSNKGGKFFRNLVKDFITRRVRGDSLQVHQTAGTISSLSMINRIHNKMVSIVKKNEEKKDRKTSEPINTLMERLQKRPMYNFEIIKLMLPVINHENSSKLNKNSDAFILWGLKRLDLRVNEFLFLKIVVEVGQIRILNHVLKHESLKNVDVLPNILIIQACERDDPEILKILLKSPKLAPNFENNWPLMYCVKKGKEKSLKILLKDKRVDPTDRQNSALSLAVKYGKINIVKIILNDKRINYRFYQPALLLAIENERVEIIVELLKKKKFVDPMEFKVEVKRKKNIEIVKSVYKFCKKNKKLEEFEKYFGKFFEISFGLWNIIRLYFNIKIVVKNQEIVNSFIENNEWEKLNEYIKKEKKIQNEYFKNLYASMHGGKKIEFGGIQQMSQTERDFIRRYFLNMSC